MPKVNRLGDVVAGIGDGPLSINGTIRAYGQAFGWLTEDIALGQVIEGGQAYLAAIHTGMDYAIVPMEPLRAASFGACGSGRWQATIQKAVTECYGSLGEMPGAAVLDAAPDGTLAIRPSYQGMGGVLYAADGSTVTLPNEPLLSLRVTGKGQAVWMGGGRLDQGPVCSVGLPPIRTAIPEVCSPLVVWVADRYWITYEFWGQRVAHPIDDPEHGYVVTTGVTFNTDAACVNGQLRITWSVTAGEYPEHVRTWAPSGDPVNLVPPPKPEPPPPEPEPTPEPEPEPEPLPEPRRIGLQTSFGGLIGRDLYRQLRRFGWNVARLDCLRNHLDPALVRESGEAGAIARLVDEAQAEGFRVVIIITSDQIPLVPDGIDVEVYADVTDTSTVGTEPDIAGLPPERIAAAINAQMSCSVAKKLTVWAGCISNPGPGPLAWLKRLAAALPADVGLTVHRYPGELGDPASKGRKPYRSRVEEMAAIKAVVGTRKWAMSEGGCPVAKKGWWLWKRECTEAQQASYIRENRTLLLNAGADYVVHWQIRGESGILRDNSTWRPGAYVTATARPR